VNQSSNRGFLNTSVSINSCTTAAAKDRVPILELLVSDVGLPGMARPGLIVPTVSGGRLRHA
jgi:hypothetical protein